MSKLVKLGKKDWKYQVIDPDKKLGRFVLTRKEQNDLKSLIVNEIDDYKMSQFVKDYMTTMQDNSYLKDNEGSRKFEKSIIYKELEMDVTDALLSLESSELYKVDIDRDNLTKEDVYNIYHNNKQPDEDTKLVFLARVHYYDPANDKDVPLYLKFNFEYNRNPKTKEIQDCINVKSFHLLETVFFDKSNYDKDLAPDAVSPEKRSYDYINEDDYLEKHPIRETINRK